MHTFTLRAVLPCTIFFLQCIVAFANPMQRESLYKTAFHHSPVPTVLLDSDLRIKDMSNYYMNLPNGKDWLNKHLMTLLLARLGEADANKVLSVVHRARDTGQPQTAEVNDCDRHHHWSIQVDTCTTKHRSIRRALNAISGRAKENLLITIQSTDITGLTQHNSLMRDKAVSADIYHAIVANLEGYAVYVLDPNGIILSWNKGAERLKLYTAEEIIGNHFAIFYQPDQRASGAPQMELENGMIEDLRQTEGWRVRKDGSRFWASIYTQPIYVNKRHYGFVKITRDLTDTIARQEAIWEGQNHAAQLKQQFLSTASHEIRSPLTGILSGLDLLLDSTPTDEQYGILETTKASGNSLLRIVNDILDYSKLEARAMTLHETYTDLHDTTLNRINNFRLRSTVPIHLSYPPTVPIRLSLDIERYLQVLTNLIDNAVRFTKRGAIQVSINIRRRTATQQNLDRIFLLVAVKDTGVGIPASEINSLFTPYSQIHNKANSGGTGLGLAISKELVELMNGSIWVESDIGMGATFYFTMECGIGEPKRGDSIPSVEEVSQRAKKLPVNLVIVVVDDNVINRKHLAKLLEKATYKVLAFESGENVLSFFENLAKDTLLHTQYIILMDIQMPPGINGLQTTRAIHEIDGMANIPVIGLTANALASDQQDCFDAGMQDYITKPFNIGDLLNRVRRIENHLTLSRGSD